ncbi:MAG: class I SAM-dependent methyltransferase [Rikenellaceae bacterium]
MSRIATAERVSLEPSDNFVLQRSRLAYHYAAECIATKAERVLEIGTGTGYGVDIIAPKAERFVSIDKHLPALDGEQLADGVELIEACVPPLPFDDATFDCVVSFQVIEHIEDDVRFVSEVYRVLKPGGRFIVSTPNIKMSLTRNPWHVREYTSEEFRELLTASFESVEAMGVVGNEQVMAYYDKNREGVERITRFDVLDLQHRLPAWMLQIPYDILNRLNRRRLLEQNSQLTQSIVMEDYRVEAVSDDAFDLIYIAKK